MTVIDTKTPALPMRAWRWIRETLATFWCDAVPFLRREIEAIRRRRV